MGKDPSQRQRPYRKYVCSSRDKEEQEIRERMARALIGTAGFQEWMNKKVIDIGRPRRGRPREWWY
jgi:hypothetical protein